jgi:L-histidine Nalpha-methyltransferase
MLTDIKISQFAKDTMKGLKAKEKYLLPKYFYDTEGSAIFRRIMRMPEYYITSCEHEIISEQTSNICCALNPDHRHMEIIEPGAGDGLKSRIILKAFAAEKTPFHYVPVDISDHMVNWLSEDLRKTIPGICIKGMAGDFFSVLGSLNGHSRRRIILFLGSNIGNFTPDECNAFLKLLSGATNAGDRVLIGFDLKKLPETIIKAYDDPYGHTRDFNINHLKRINRELEADFDTGQFFHHTSYDPITGEMKSFLVSRWEQTVHIAGEKIHFHQWEAIFMELSKKYSLREIDELAKSGGFKMEKNFFDSRNYFTDSLWVKL